MVILDFISVQLTEEQYEALKVIPENWYTLENKITKHISMDIIRTLESLGLVSTYYFLKINIKRNVSFLPEKQ